MDEHEELSPEEAAQIVAATRPAPEPVAEPTKQAESRDQQLAADIGVETTEEAVDEVEATIRVLKKNAQLRDLVFQEVLAGRDLADLQGSVEFFFQEAARAIRDVARLRVVNRRGLKFMQKLVAAAEEQQRGDARLAASNPEFIEELEVGDEPEIEVELELDDLLDEDDDLLDDDEDLE